jgi:O-acetyl-ADP-ribose deacetylase (regulator of RNase III)
MNQITYLKGDATKPDYPGNKIIVHICNDIGAWGAGFVLAVSKRWKTPESEYKKLFKAKPYPKLGYIQFVQTEEDIYVANLIGQRHIAPNKKGNPPIRYDAVELGLKKLSEFAKSIGASVHMPRIGCGLAGGSWEKIEPLIEKHICENGISVFVYDYIAE